jgi:hypothetical protein
MTIDPVGLGLGDDVIETVGVGLGDAIVIVFDGVGDGGGVDATAAGAMVTLNVAVAAAPAVAVTATEKVPAAVGVPLIVPAELIVSPPGSPLAVYVMVPAPPVATTAEL